METQRLVGRGKRDAGENTGGELGAGDGREPGDGLHRYGDDRAERLGGDRRHRGGTTLSANCFPTWELSPATTSHAGLTTSTTCYHTAVTPL